MSKQERRLSQKTTLGTQKQPSRLTEETVNNIYKVFNTEIDAEHREPTFDHIQKVIDIINNPTVPPEKEYATISNKCKRMEEVREKLVDVYYEQFNETIRHYSNTLNQIRKTEEKIENLGETISETSTLFKNRGAIIQSNYRQTMKCTYMLEMLTQIEEITKFPENYAKLIQQTEYLEAAVLLKNIYNLVTSPELRRIGAISLLSTRIIKERESNFHKILVSMIHNIVYMKGSSSSGVFYVSIDDDGKEGFTRQEIKKTDKKDSRFGQASLSKSESRPAYDFVKGKNKEEAAIIELVDALWALDRVQAANKEISSAIRDELGSFIKNIIPSLTDLSTKKQLMFSKILVTVFKECKQILHYHKLVCSSFAKKFESPTGHILPAIPSNEKKQETEFYSLEFVCTEIKREIQNLIETHLGVLHFDKGSSAQTASTVSNRKLFSFQNSQNFVQYCDTALEHTYADFIQQFGTEPSLYNLTEIYSAILRFDDSIFTLIGSNSANGLKSWVEDLVTNKFMPFIKSDYVKRRIASIQAPDAWIPSLDRDMIPKQNEDEEEQRPLMNSSLAIFKCIFELQADAIAITNQQRYFHEIMSDDILNHYLNAFQTKRNQLLLGTETGQLIESGLMKMRLLSKKHSFIPAITPDLTNTNLRISTLFTDDQEEQAAYEAKERILEDPCYKGFRITKPDQLLSLECLTIDKDERIPQQAKSLNSKSSLLNISSHDARESSGIIGTLATMHESLEWLNAKISELDTIDVRASPQKKVTPLWKNSPKDVTKASARQARIPIGRVLHDATEKIKKLSQECLLAICTELRLWIFYYLHQIQTTSYLEDASCDHFVTTLNFKLSAAKSTLSLYLSKNKVSFIFESLPSLASNILMSSLSKIKEINSQGINKMKRNISSLQQNFFSITGREEEKFDRVRKYYQLLDNTLPNLRNAFVHAMSSTEKSTPPFTQQEWSHLFILKSAGRNISSQDKDLIFKLFSDQGGTS